MKMKDYFLFADSISGLELARKEACGLCEFDERVSMSYTYGFGMILGRQERR
jgi:hypothetical protein